MVGIWSGLGYLFEINRSYLEFDVYYLEKALAYSKEILLINQDQQPCGNECACQPNMPGKGFF